MSHYISANIDKDELPFTYGSNHRTIRAASETGFSIYNMYEAWDFNNGVSGSGDSKTVNFKLAEKAYLHAVAWALSLKQSFPKIFDIALKEIQQHDKLFNTYLFNNIFNKTELNELIKQKAEYHSQTEDEIVERSFRLLYSILRFTYKIYKYTEKGKEIEIYFG